MFITQAFVLSSVFVTATIACSDGFEMYSEFCYKLLPVRASWAEAMQYCNTIGATLAVISDDAERTFIESMLHKQQSNITTSQIWIGGTDLLQEGVWLEPVTREPLTYFNWGAGEPDNLGGQHCLAMFNSASLVWDDNLCEVLNYALCKTNDFEGIVGK